MQVRERLPWYQQQVEWCSGLSVPKLDGIKISTYGHGTVLCEKVMDVACSNSGVIDDPVYKKACFCVLNQARLKNMYAGLDMPVQCFHQVCNRPNSDEVYRPAGECNSKVCEQVLELNGSAIALTGSGDGSHQKLECDGVIYHIDTKETPDGKKFFKADAKQAVGEESTPTIGTAFYFGLAFLAIMVLITVVWGVRRFIISRRTRKGQNEALARQLLGRRQ